MDFAKKMMTANRQRWPDHCALCGCTRDEPDGWWRRDVSDIFTCDITQCETHLLFC